MPYIFFLVVAFVLTGCSGDGTPSVISSGNSSPAVAPQTAEVPASSPASLANASSALILGEQAAALPSSAASQGPSGEVCLSDLDFSIHEFTSDNGTLVEENCRKIKALDGNGNEVEIKLVSDCSIRVQTNQLDTLIRICNP